MKIASYISICIESFKKNCISIITVGLLCGALATALFISSPSTYTSSSTIALNPELTSVYELTQISESDEALSKTLEHNKTKNYLIALSPKSLNIAVSYTHLTLPTICSV